MHKRSQQFLGPVPAWPLTHCDLKQSLFYSCSSLHQTEPSPAPHSLDDVLTTLVIVGVIREEQAQCPLLHSGGGAPLLWQLGPSSSGYLLGGIWMVQEGLGPKEAINFFPVNKREQALPEGLVASKPRYCPRAASHS